MSDDDHGFASIEAVDALERRLAALEGTGDRLTAVEQVIADGFRGEPRMWDAPIEHFHDDAAGLVRGFKVDRRPARPVYPALQDIFRGPADFVADRQRPYLDMIGERTPVLDVGCGRGEFLDLLTERDLEPIGVDSDADMVERCRARGHDAVVHADANSYLAGREDDVLGAVFAAQVLEHMPVDYLRRFLELTLKKLRPGGVLIAEMPNPHSAHSLKTFWVDLTHERPVFPEVALALCWAMGFGSAFVCHPVGRRDVRLDQFAEPEYAVVATKPMPWDGATSAPVTPEP